MPLRIADRALGLSLKVQRDIFLEKTDRIDYPSILKERGQARGLTKMATRKSHRAHKRVPGTKRFAARPIASRASGSP